MLFIVKDSAILIRENDLRHREDVSQTNSQRTGEEYTFPPRSWPLLATLLAASSQRLYFGDGAHNLQSVNGCQ